MRRLADRLRVSGRVGFVPTMGCLHEGHLSLVRIARRNADHVVVSLFVNPMQFGAGEDLARYPRDIARDRRLLRREGVDVLFHPAGSGMYPEGYCTGVEVERLSTGLCGESRPGHFRGVTTVVAKLFNIVRPRVAVFGQKDAQQAFIIRRMVRDLDFDVEIVVGPTVREADGLAMSSRNAFLTPKQREQAPVLYQSLQLARQLVRSGETSAARVRSRMRRLLRTRPGVRVQYVALVDTGELKPVKVVLGEVLIAVAAFLGRTRLIDNVIVRA